MVHIHSISIRIIHFIVIHPGHLASTRKIAVNNRSNRDGLRQGGLEQVQGKVPLSYSKVSIVRKEPSRRSHKSHILRVSSIVSIRSSDLNAVCSHLVRLYNLLLAPVVMRSTPGWRLLPRLTLLVHNYLGNPTLVRLVLHRKKVTRFARKNADSSTSGGGNLKSTFPVFLNVGA